jgi:hypothetical protein
MRTGPGAWPYDVGVLAPDQTPHDLEQGAVQTAAQVQRAEKQAGRRLRVGRQRRRLDQAVDLEHGSPADGAVGAREVLSQLLSDARGDSTDQTGGSDRA